MCVGTRCRRTVCWRTTRSAAPTRPPTPGVDEDTVGKLLNHGGRSVTSRYIKTSYLGRMLAAAQEDISAHIVKALGRRVGWGDRVRLRRKSLSWIFCVR